MKGGNRRRKVGGAVIVSDTDDESSVSKDIRLPTPLALKTREKVEEEVLFEEPLPPQSQPRSKVEEEILRMQNRRVRKLAKKGLVPKYKRDPILTLENRST
jgi:hypothetical protein